MQRWSRHLYLRIWLAVVLGVALLMLLVTLVIGWAWRTAERHYRPPAPREWVLRDENGEVLDRAPLTSPSAEGRVLEFEVMQPDGTVRRLLIERRRLTEHDHDEHLPPGMAASGSVGGPVGGPGHGPGLAGHLPPGVGPAWRARPEPPPWWLQPSYGFALMLGAMGLAAALALYPVVRRLTKRLEVLQTSLQRWGEGDLSVRVPEVGDDEVADLSRRFNDAAGRIEQLMSAQKSLLANASHELRSPLARIRMGIELLDAPAADAAMRARTRDEIVRNMAELDQLIDEILLSSRLDARESDLGTIELVDLVGLCAEEAARTEAQLQVEGSGAMEVQGVVKLLRRLVRNLLENARRYGSVEAGVGAQGLPEPVLIELQHQSGQVVLRVCDRGPGVPEAWRERIFEPFLRLPGASEQAGGVGLGLALVRSIAERHGGQVRCEARAGGGACFVVSLPTA